MTQDAPSPAAAAGWYPDPDQAATQRYWDGTGWTDQRAPTAEPEPKASTANLIPFGIACLGTVVAVVAVFLPRLESVGFAKIAENSLIQNGDGVLPLILAAAALAMSFAMRKATSRNVLVVLLGIAIVGFAVYNGTGERLLLESIGPLGDGSTVEGDPGIGLWALGIAGAIIAASGLIRPSSGSAQDA